jgi:hypothetical protein
MKPLLIAALTALVGGTTFLVPSNWGSSTLASQASAGDPTWTVTSGASFPTTYPYHVVCGNEIAKVTNNAANVLTVTRAQESTTAAIHPAGSTVRLNVTAAYISELQDAVNAIEDNTTTLDGVTLTDDLLPDAGATVNIGDAGSEVADIDYSGTLTGVAADFTGAVTCVGLSDSGMVQSTSGIISTDMDPADVPAATDFCGLGFYQATGDGYLIVGQSPDFLDWSDAEDLNVICKNAIFGVPSTSASFTYYAPVLAATSVSAFALAGGDAKMYVGDSDVGHGITSEAATSSFLDLDSASSTDGGGRVQGFSDSALTSGLELDGYMGGGASTTVPAMVLDLAERSGTNTDALESTELGLQVTNNGTAFIDVVASGKLVLRSIAGYGVPEASLADADVNTGFTAMPSTASVLYLRSADADGSGYILGATDAASDAEGLRLRGCVQAGSTSVGAVTIEGCEMGAAGAFGALDTNELVCTFQTPTTIVATLDADGDAQFDGDLDVDGNDIDLGDAGGFSGVKFNPAATTLDFYIDGTKVAHLDTAGALTDDVP